MVEFANSHGVKRCHSYSSLRGWKSAQENRPTASAAKGDRLIPATRP